MRRERHIHIMAGILFFGICALNAGAMTWDGQSQVDPYTVALYHMNEGSGTTLIDAAGNYDMTGTGTWSTPTAWDTSGTSTYCTAAVMTYMTSSTSFTPDYNQDMTIETWFKSDGYTVTGTNTTFGWDQNWDNQARMIISSGYLTLDFCERSFASGVGRDGVWHHAAMSYVASTGIVTFYIDNVIVDSGDAGSRRSEATPLFDRFLVGDGYYFDEAQIRVGIAATDFSQPVPEPATMGLLALGAVGLLRRRRRT